MVATRALLRPFAAMGGVDVNVAEIGESGAIGDHAGEADLFRTVVNAPSQGVADGLLDDGAGNAFGPIGFSGDKGVDAVEIEARGIV